MRPQEPLEGRVFISHSSLDKEFVRRLDAALEEKGFRTWLDEKELFAGDQLAKEIGRAIADAGALIVVVSSNSLRSDWLSYELNLAVERSIKGDLRIIPVVVDTDQMPDELKGRLYADFRRSFKHGLDLVVPTLEQERGVARAGWHAFAAMVEDALYDVFDGVGFADVGGRDFASVTYDLVFIRPPGANAEVEVAYEVMPDYSGDGRPLTRGSILEYAEMVESHSARRALLVSERPIEFVDEHWEQEGERVWFLHEPADTRWLDLMGADIVAVDLSDEPPSHVARRRLAAARRVFEAYPDH